MIDDNKIQSKNDFIIVQKDQKHFLLFLAKNNNIFNF